MQSELELVERLQAHEGLGAALAHDAGQTGQYVRAVMDEAAAAIERLDHECQESMAAIAAERARAEAAEARAERLLAERDNGTTLYAVISDIRKASGLGGKPMLSELADEIGKIVAERDEARALVAEANNSLYGSQGYFHSLNGGCFDKYHLANGIEELKARARQALKDTP